MKFRNPNTGEEFTETDGCFCGEYELYTGSVCISFSKKVCPICYKIGRDYHDCKSYIRDNPKEAAALMGYELVDDHSPDPTKKVNQSTNTSTDKLQYINSVYGRDEIFCQTSEESVELAQACDDLRRASMKLSKAVLKLRRAEHGTTPVSLAEATRAVLEECADVTVCIRALEALGVFNREELDSVVQENLERWERRAQEYEKRGATE